MTLFILHVSHLCVGGCWGWSFLQTRVRHRWLSASSLHPPWVTNCFVCTVGPFWSILMKWSEIFWCCCVEQSTHERQLLWVKLWYFFSLYAAVDNRYMQNWVLSLKTSKPPLTITSAHRFDLRASWDGFAWTRSSCRCKVSVPKHFFPHSLLSGTILLPCAMQQLQLWRRQLMNHSQSVSQKPADSVQRPLCRSNS